MPDPGQNTGLGMPPVFPGNDQVRDDDALTADLLARAQAGDRAALGRLLEQQRGWLRRIADDLLDPRVRGRLDASDVIQQTCLSVHRQIAHFDGHDPAQFVAWLRQIHEHNVQNANREQLHAARRHAGKDHPLTDIDIADRIAETPSRRLSREEEASRLKAVLDTLPADEREALRLRYVDQQSLENSAAAMGLTRDALLWLIKRGLRRAREQLESDRHV
jgi:RNA polymerase sigma-70 factor (ECF subfamily)